MGAKKIKLTSKDTIRPFEFFTIAWKSASHEFIEAYARWSQLLFTKIKFGSWLGSSRNATVSEDILVAVVGVTGSGKSSFIKRVTGDEEIEIGHDYDSSLYHVNYMK